MKVKLFEFMSKDEQPCDEQRQARSRIYEYPFVLKCIKMYWTWKTIHNTWCWGWEVHLKFAEELDKYWIVTNTDNDAWQRQTIPKNFMHYDILKECDFQSDIVLCVSTLEHLWNQVLALQNLLEATKEWWLLIITLDSPPVDLKKIEEYLWVKCEWSESKLNQWNSKVPNPLFEEEINVVKLVIQK